MDKDKEDPESKHVDHPPIIEKAEHRFVQDVDHQSPQKSEHDLSFIDSPDTSDHPSV